MRPVKLLKKHTTQNLSFFSARGFTLIEMAMVIMILGFIVAAFTPLYKTYLDNKAAKDTQADIDYLSAAIGSFRSLNGRYPCPASLVAQRGDDAYGRENCSNLNAAVAVNSCDLAATGTGLCRELAIPARLASYRDPYTAGNPQINNVRPIVRVGAVPFRELGIPEKNAYDGYGSRIQYAVTENLTNDITFTQDAGGIDIVNNDTPMASIVAPAGSVHFLILSTGKNTNGAFDKFGGRNPCAAGPENMNCNVGVSQYRLMPHSNAAAGVFDDVMTYFTQSEVPLWRFSTEPGAEEHIVQIPDGDVGMNFASATNGFRGEAGDVTGTTQIDVIGDLRASDDPIAIVALGNIMSDTICPISAPGNDCFTPAALAGNIAKGTGGMECPSGQYMVAIAKGSPVCMDAELKCEDGVMTGIDAKGRVLCTSPVGCDAASVNLCSQSFTLDAGPGGADRTVTAGLTAIRTFRCTNGSWEQLTLPSEGVCDCAPKAQQQRDGSCGPGFTGTVVGQTRDWACPAAGSPPGTMPAWTPWKPPSYGGVGQTYTYAATSPCRCIGGTQDQLPVCPTNTAPYDANGNLVTKQTRTMTCSNNGLTGTWGAWTPTYTCKCVPPAVTTETQTVRCTGNRDPNSTKTQERVFDTNLCAWSGWKDKTNCTCTQSWSETRVENKCPKGDIGTITNVYTYDCDGSVTVKEVVPERKCEKAKPVTCLWKPIGSPNLSPGAAGPKAGSVCANCGETAPQCYSGSGPFQIYNNCSCGD